MTAKHSRDYVYLCYLPNLCALVSFHISVSSALQMGMTYVFICIESGDVRSVYMWSVKLHVEMYSNAKRQTANLRAVHLWSDHPKCMLIPGVNRAWVLCFPSHLYKSDNSVYRTYLLYNFKQKSTILWDDSMRKAEVGVLLWFETAVLEHCARLF